MEQRTTGASGRPDTEMSRADERDGAVSMPLHAERIAVGKRRVEEMVSVKRATQTKTVSVEEVLTTENVVVEHVHIGQFVDSVPPIREQGDTTIMPIVEEVAVLVKRLYLKEEVRVTKTRTTAPHIETVTLREQHARVTRTSVPAKADTERLAPAPLTPTRNSKMDSHETIVAVYDTPAHAGLAVGDLLEAKVPQSAISRHEGFTTGTAAIAPREQGFWASLFGGETTADEHLYERSAQSGSSVVSVKTPIKDVEAVMEILERHNPVNLDERAATYGAATRTETSSIATGYEPSTAAIGIPPAPNAYADHSISTTATGGDTVQLSEEQLVVGKRLVNRGGTRLRRYVVETPVQEDVSLHSETVQVERRPVTGGAVTDADFSGKTIEMTATAEEAVVGKTAHVVEEVSLRKQAADRVETVRDTVRKEEVEVEQIPGETVGETTIPKAASALDPRLPRI